MTSYRWGHRDPGLELSDAWWDDLHDALSPQPPAGRADCCPAEAVYRVALPPTAVRRHTVELLLCGHHFHQSRAALRTAGATVFDLTGRVIDSPLLATS